MPYEKGRVRALLASLFRPDLGFVKSANLAGHMTSNLWTETHWKGTSPGNVAQAAIAILMSASAYPYRSRSDVAVYPWCHQKALGKRGWFFSIDHSEPAKLAASEWYKQKAQELTHLEGEETFYRRLNISVEEDQRLRLFKLSQLRTRELAPEGAFLLKSRSIFANRRAGRDLSAE
jgi:hypothetical protein